MYSNYNVLVLPMSCDGKYQIGDIYRVSDEGYYRFWRFDGLQIKNVDYLWGVRLHFDYKEWFENDIDEKRLQAIHDSFTPIKIEL